MEVSVPLASKILLSLDQASKTSGWALFEDGELVKHGKFTFEDAEINVRLVKIRNKVKELIDEYNVTEVVYEDIQQQDNVVTFKILAEVYGVIGELLAELNVPHSTVLASSWKSTLGIKGKNRAEQKRNAQAYIVSHYNLTPTQDESDAICIGIHHLKHNQCAW